VTRKSGAEMSPSGDGSQDDVLGAGKPHHSRRRPWPRARASSRSAKSSDDEPWGWSVGVSDWPIGKTDYDLSADQAIKAVLGLDRYYEHAMTTLSHAQEDDEGLRADGGSSSR
jgi:hypothetical protein